MSKSPYRKAPETRSSFINGIKSPESRFYWDKFYDFYADLLLNVAYRNGIRQQEAEDILQETICDIAKGVQSFDYDKTRSGFRAWICTIMRRRICDSFRKNGRERKISVRLDDNDPLQESTVPDDREELGDLIRNEWMLQMRTLALNRLREIVSPAQFAVFEAVEIAEWPIEQAMKTFAVSRDAIYQTRHRVKPRYAEILAEVAKALDNPL